MKVLYCRTCIFIRAVLSFPNYRIRFCRPLWMLILIYAISSIKAWGRLARLASQSSTWIFLRQHCMNPREEKSYSPILLNGQVLEKLSTRDNFRLSVQLTKVVSKFMLNALVLFWMKSKTDSQMTSMWTSFPWNETIHPERVLNEFGTLSERVLNEFLTWTSELAYFRV